MMYREYIDYNSPLFHLKFMRSRLNSERKSNIMEQYYIIRADRAGVFFGQIESKNGDEVTMKNVRRLWYWNGACSLSELATNGTKRPDDCKFTVTVESMTILGVIEVIKCTDKAVKSIKAVKEWKF